MDVFRLFYGTVKARMPEEVTVWLQVGGTLWEAAPRRMRSELWHSVLHRRGTGVVAVAQYKKYLAQVSGRAGGRTWRMPAWADAWRSVEAAHAGLRGMDRVAWRMETW